MTALLASVPPSAQRRLAVRVTRDAERQLRGGHPWLFDGSIVSVSHDGSPGDLAVVFDDDRKFLAIGLWDPASPIRVRVLHHGNPRTIDDEFWADRIDRAVELRAPLLADGTTTGHRLLHGENDGFGGLVVDVYDTTAVTKLYSAAWFPHLASLLPLLAERSSIDRVVLRLGRLVERGSTHGLNDGDTLVGSRPTASVPFFEHGLAFTADVERGQKTGHFLDQRHNRHLVGRLADGAAVLDVFCATGGFSVHAAAGGAQEVVSTDVSRHALAATTAHMSANLGNEALAACRHRTQRGDAFDVMSQLAERRQSFDMVIIDPPSFASRRRDIDRALHAYGRLTALAFNLLVPGGTLVQASCSSRVGSDVFFDRIHDVADRTRRKLYDVVTTAHDSDHPVTFPEGAYLKAMFAHVD